MLDLYGIDDPDERTRLAGLAKDGQPKNWWASYDDVLPAGTSRYLSLEATAAELRAYNAQAIPVAGGSGTATPYLAGLRSTSAWKPRRRSSRHVMPFMPGLLRAAVFNVVYGAVVVSIGLTFWRALIAIAAGILIGGRRHRGC